ncbi:MAG: hypothetical protein ACYS74_21735 [Planctomycetota bacterium]|jgi:hypothetical protein
MNDETIPSFTSLDVSVRGLRSLLQRGNQRILGDGPEPTNPGDRIDCGGNGYRLAQDKADYYLLFDYGIDAGRTVTDAVPIHRPMLYDEYPFSGFYWHGYTTYVPYSEVIHTRWLILKIVEGRAYEASKNAEPLWIGEITSAGASSDLRELLNYMLVAAFEHFAEDTRRQLATAISRDDERVRLLTEP